ncbi:hypothetical protein J3L16_03375 [Alteromonas sp. 5E99-2]|uniref:hypothetical protein n=1 Tax=Alteromonas sp. 5E99-2 TaxID=2817683 RepID=UPI001A995DB7|nr:hypothetical protein [Alteromonas sp. 5E99-2]MBO1254726.1 hypothetical protein [Alteromonas sp. 5E99-2]
MNTFSKIVVIVFSGLINAIAQAHNGHGDELPWQACSTSEKNTPCEYTNSHGDIYQGNCKLFGEALMCVRNKPIVRANMSKMLTPIKLDNSNQGTK